jgi:hypothetical protein
LGRGGVKQIIAAHNLADPLLVIVDDCGEVVGVGAVTAADDDVIDEAGLGTVVTVGEADLGAAGSYAQSGGTDASFSFGLFCTGEVATGTGVAPWLAVGSGGRFLDLSPRAPARVDETLPLEACQC